MPSSPSYRGLYPASENASKAKRSNHSLDTKHEKMLRLALWHLGLRYRKNVAYLPGKPDIVFPKYKVAIFCDGDFWHGHNWPELRSQLEKGTNASYWVAKIENNRARDSRNTEQLENEGWFVIRVWESDIKSDVDEVSRLVSEIIHTRMQKASSN